MTRRAIILELIQNALLAYVFSECAKRLITFDGEPVLTQRLDETAVKTLAAAGMEMKGRLSDSPKSLLLSHQTEIDALRRMADSSNPSDLLKDYRRTAENNDDEFLEFALLRFGIGISENVIGKNGRLHAIKDAARKIVERAETIDSERIATESEAVLERLGSALTEAKAEAILSKMADQAGLSGHDRAALLQP
jgi:hypothetical protein